MRKRVAILGSTGSIGTQALEVVEAAPERFDVVALAAGGSDPALLAAQAVRHEVELVAVARATSAQDVQLALYAEAQRRGWSEGDHRLPRLLKRVAGVGQGGVAGGRGLLDRRLALGDHALGDKDRLLHAVERLVRPDPRAPRVTQRIARAGDVGRRHYHHRPPRTLERRGVGKQARSERKGLERAVATAH